MTTIDCGFVIDSGVHYRLFREDDRHGERWGCSWCLGYRAGGSVLAGPVCTEALARAQRVAEIQWETELDEMPIHSNRGPGRAARTVRNQQKRRER